MRITQSVFGVFHHFELAAELEKRGHLQQLYSSWPWARLKREGLPKNRVSTFPWVHTPAYLFEQTRFSSTASRQQLHLINASLFDRWILGRMKSLYRSGGKIDAHIAISGSATKAGEWLQKQGGLFICDRGSTHHRFQSEIVAEEDRLWGVERPPVSDPRVTAMEEHQYAFADAITVPSGNAARSFFAMGVPEDKVHVIPLGVRLQRFQPSGEPNPDTFDLLFAGSVSLRKGIPYLLQAFAKLRHPAKRLRIAGSVDAAIKPILDRLPSDGVEWLGSVPQTRLAELMSKSHALVLPSIEDGFGMVMAQAMACGCPVISSFNTGGPDLYTDGVEGFIVPIRDADTLADRMQQLADHPALQQSMRHTAQERVKRIGGWAEYGMQWEALLTKLLARR